MEDLVKYLKTHFFFFFGNKVISNKLMVKEDVTDSSN
jgi:hypothetical protein